MLADTHRHVLFDFRYRLTDCVGIGHLVGAAVALDDDAPQSNQARTIVLAWIDAISGSMSPLL